MTMTLREMRELVGKKCQVDDIEYLVLSITEDWNGFLITEETNSELPRPVMFCTPTFLERRFV